jgi:hypothetical protein
MYNNLKFTEQIENASKRLDTQSDNFESLGSVWQYSNVENSTVNLIKYDPTGASSYLPTADFIDKRRTIVDIKNTDQKCFLYSVLAGLYPDKSNKNRVSSYLDHVDRKICQA